MNQTLTVNISGIVFHIEVDAYDTLKNYLSKIKSNFSNSEEREEIMHDIESRIAELFGNMMNEKNEVIKSSDVEKIIAIMGKPEQYVTENEEEEEKVSYTQEPAAKGDKKLFRNTDDRLLGGVCSGLSAYIGVDTVWIRLFFVAALFLGFGFLMYIILWIVMPAAKTASDKLKMNGEPINVHNIGKKFEEEANKVADNLKNMNSKDFTKKVGSGLEKLFSAIATILTSIFKIIGKIIGILFLIIGTFMLVVLLGMLFGTNEMISITNDGVFTINSHDFLNLIFVSPNQMHLAIIGVILLIGAPILTLIYLAIKLLFKIKSHYSIGLILFIMFIVGASICGIVGIKMATECGHDEEIVKTQQISTVGSTLLIKSSNELLSGKGILELEDKVTNISIDGDTIYQSFVGLEIEKSKTDSIQLEVRISSNGSSQKDALNKVHAINYNYQISDSTLVFDNYLSTLKENKIRGQEVKLKLYIPLNQVIYLDESLEELLDNVNNVSDTYDKKMVGNKWIMLENGLTCLDCTYIQGVTTQDLDTIKKQQPLK